ncbi:acyl-CoA synthetase (AMP-forming)/AMP-acid ligase II [Promicromonospora sp. AC04]|uniref:AMP-binding protein n=1 Tax=Promicromonospora sp. AC04 TaxID=2135723 RepID=UPI000D357FEE|nr:AMP-binding protein [Promicromonospora sp. AC04]PUB26010.1 acyl-CoA synthetase (AMP-forming)/AMP-acid ligase II [Promicromonospora sp. AC04]
MDQPTPNNHLSRANYATIWESVARAVPDRAAVIADGRSMTYRELDDAAARVAGTLRAEGLGAGSRVAIFMYNRVEYLVTVYAAYKIGAIPVNINFRYQGRELADLLRASRAAALVHPTSLGRHVRDAAPHVPLPALVLAVPDDDGPTAPGRPFATALDAEPLAPRSLSPDHQIFMFTGGTTGTPKAVVWTHGNLFDSQLFSIYGSLPVVVPKDLDEVTRIAARTDLPPTVTLPLTPLMHALALFNVMNALVLGGCVIFLPSVSHDPLAAARTIHEMRVTRLIVAGNAVVGPLVDALDSPEGAGLSVTSLTTVLSSGMAWSDDLKLRLIGHAPRATLIDIFGSSEGGPFAYGVVRGPQDIPCHPRLAPGTVVFDAEMREVQDVPGATGVLAYRGQMPLGYDDDPVRTAEAYPTINGVRYVMPGDHVRVLGDGLVELLGRGSAVVNTGGEKVFTGEVETVLTAIPGVTDAVVFGTPDPRWGEVVTAYVVTAPGASLTVEQVQEEVGRRLAGYKKPRKVFFVDALDRSPSGKLNMRALRTHVPELETGQHT